MGEGRDRKVASKRREYYVGGEGKGQVSGGREGSEEGKMKEGNQ